MSFDAWDMVNLYRLLPTWFRVALGILIFAIAVGICWTGQRRVAEEQAKAIRLNKPADPLIERRAQGAFRGGIYLSALGCIIIATSGRSRSEQNGYHF